MTAASHVRNAIARFNRTAFESVAAKERVRQKDPSGGASGRFDVQGIVLRQPRFGHIGRR